MAGTMAGAGAGAGAVDRVSIGPNDAPGLIAGGTGAYPTRMGEKCACACRG